MTGTEIAHGARRQGRANRSKWLICLVAVLSAGLFAVSVPSAAGASRPLLAMPQITTFAHTFTVNSTNDTHAASPGSGACADAQGHCSLRAAIEEANGENAAVQIDLPAGNYVLSLGVLTVSDTAGVSIVGTGNPVINGNGTTQDLVVAAAGVLQASGLTVAGGTVTGDGGGLDVIAAGSAVLNDVTVSGNTATGNGGGINSLGNLWVLNSILTGNMATNGGGLWAAQGQAQLTNDSLTTNTVSNEGGGLGSVTLLVVHGGSFTGNRVVVPNTNSGAGGGIFATSNSSFSGVTISGNTVGPASGAVNVSASGGGITCCGAYYSMTNSTVTGNSAVAAGTGNASGGGMSNSYGILTSDLISGNTASNSGGTGNAFGGGIDDGSPLILRSSTVTGNTATTAGGGIYNGSAASVENSTISFNTAGSGGGYYENGLGSIVNSTIAENTGTSFSGAAGVFDATNLTATFDTVAYNAGPGTGGVGVKTAVLNLGSTIIGPNTGPGGVESECSVTTPPAIVSNGYNLVGDTSCGLTGPGDQQGLSPKLGPLQNNDGATQTAAPGPGSPAIGNGGPNCPSLDQRGAARPLANCTVGAVQVTGWGYLEVASDGGVFNFGNAGFFGSMGGKHLNAPMVGIDSTSDGNGYWEVASDGGVFNFGDAGFFGSMGGKPLVAPVVGIAGTSTGKGYWEVASDGGVFTFGDASFFGSMGGKSLTESIVGISATPDNQGYWLFGSQGAVYAFGDAVNFGSMSGQTLNALIVGVATTPDGGGYWQAGSDGGVFNFGDTPGFFGSLGGVKLNKPIIGIGAAPGGNGYWLAGGDGGVFAFGDAPYLGSMGGKPLNAPVVGFASLG